MEGIAREKVSVSITFKVVGERVSSATDDGAKQVELENILKSKVKGGSSSPPFQ